MVFPRQLLLKNWNGVAGSRSVGQLVVNPCGSFTPLSFGFPRPVQLKSVQQDFLVTIPVNGNRDPPVPNNNHAYDHPPCPPEGCEDDVNGSRILSISVQFPCVPSASEVWTTPSSVCSRWPWCFCRQLVYFCSADCHS